MNVRKSRTAAVGVVFAVALLGGTAEVAHAGNTWTLAGPNRPVYADAEADIPVLKAKCRRQNGNPISATVEPAPASSNIFYASITCQALR